MKRKIRIGIPRALLYFKYKDLWETFFRELDCDVILSPESNKELLKIGINNSIDEACLSSKIYMGHIYFLLDKVDYILVPRFCSFKKGDVVCTKFNAMYDIVRNTYPDVKLIDYNMDIIKGNTEFKGLFKMGLKLKKNIFQIVKAYYKAKKVEHQNKEKLYAEQDQVINDTKELKMLLVGHPYNTYDRLLGFPIVKYLNELNVRPIYADRVNSKECIKCYKEITKSLHWTYSKELVGAIEYYKDKIDGIVFISTFPCGPDSLVNELCIRKLKGIPMLNIILDELQGEEGLYTRIESFIDIIKIRKERMDN